MAGDVVYVVSTQHGYVGEHGRLVASPENALIMGRPEALYHARMASWNGKPCQAWSYNLDTRCMRKVHKAVERKEGKA